MCRYSRLCRRHCGLIHWHWAGVSSRSCIAPRGGCGTPRPSGNWSFCWKVCSLGPGRPPWGDNSHTQISIRWSSDFRVIHGCLEVVSSSDTIPYFIRDLFLIASLMAAADQEPDEKQEEKQQQESTDHRPDYDSHLVGSWKRGDGALRLNRCSSPSLQSWIPALTRGLHMILQLAANI